MKILLLELTGYLRFRLARLNKVVYTPQARQQLILGTNGSGKSSLLDELSPLPGHHSAFAPGGQKHIELEHGAHHYILVSSFKSGNRHSFFKDGVELNEGGTYQVQLKLVKDEFRYTEKLHELLTGRIRFTEMRPQERREWITLLSEADLTYALSVYQQFKTKARDAQGAYKHAQLRYAQESQNLAALNDTDVLKSRFETLREELNLILTSITPNIPQYDALVTQLDQAYRTVCQDSERLLKQLPSFLFDGQYTGLPAMDQALQDAQLHAEVERVALKRAGQDVAELDAILASFGGQQVEDVTQAPEQLQAIQSQLARLQGQSSPFPPLEDTDSIARDWSQVHTEFRQLLQTLPDNSTGQYSRQRHQALLDEYAQLSSSIDQCQGELNRKADRLAHLKGQHDVSCPKCQHQWKIGVDPREVVTLEQIVLELSETLSKRRADQKELEAQLETVDAYIALWGRFRGFVQSYPRLQPLWTYLLDQRCMTDQPSEQLHVLTAWEQHVTAALEREHLQTRQKKLELIVDAQKQFGGTGKLQLKRDALEQEVARLTPSLQQRQRTIDCLMQQRKQALTAIEQLNLIDTQLATLVQGLETAITAIRNKLLDALGRERHVEMSAIQRKLTDRMTLAGIVKDLEQEVATLEVRYKTFQYLSALLSPTEGIIAERLKETIFSIVDQMNTIIASVWTHALRIMECGLENNDLDYKFPVQVESPENVTADISRASKGQMEMINIAFKLTAMLYLEFLDYPLFMDEPGEGFDEQHRDQIMSLIRQMLDSGHYSQLFMVSHFASSHGAFLDAQILVLDASNIALPGTYNEHVLLE